MRSRRLDIFASDFGRDAGWDVFRGDAWLLSLVDARFEDMFWYSYRLDPAAAAATRADFWSQGDLVIRSKLNGETVRGWFTAPHVGPDRVHVRGLSLDPGWPRWPWPWEAVRLRALRWNERPRRSAHNVPDPIRSTLAMFECAFGAGHRFSAREILACIEIMAEDGMSDRSIAMVVARLCDQPAHRYADYLQEVSIAVRDRCSDPAFVRELVGRLQSCGYSAWRRDA